MDAIVRHVDDGASSGVSLQILGYKANATDHTCTITLQGSVANTQPRAQIKWYQDGKQVGSGQSQTMKIR